MNMDMNLTNMKLPKEKILVKLIFVFMKLCQENQLIPNIIILINTECLYIIRF